MLYGWMKSLIIYLILSGVVMNMTPKSAYKKYINSFMGLIILIILANPLSYIFHISSGDISGFVDELTEYMSEDGELAEYDDIYNYYEMSLAETIRLDLTGEGYAVSEISIITDDEGNVLKCTAVVENDSGEDLSSMKNYISEVYNIETNNIYIVRR